MGRKMDGSVNPKETDKTGMDLPWIGFGFGCMMFVPYGFVLLYVTLSIAECFVKGRVANGRHALANVLHSVLCGVSTVHHNHTWCRIRGQVPPVGL